MTPEDSNALLARHHLGHAGAPLESARRVVVCLHGRGATAADILGIAGAIGLGDIAYLAPQARGGAWYPRPFMEPLDANEPDLSAALDRIAAILADLDAAGIGADKVVIAGFSQGACLSLEFAARHPGHVAAVLGFSGGLIGPSVEGREETGRLDGLPVFIGCSERDPFIPAVRVRETAAHYEARGAAVTSVLYPEPGHTINMDEIGRARALLQGLAG
ncbi:MAG: dienelactone hydrolase family protein [Aurantimonas coralicida]|nr:dienelactone hydrolase family protein [Aurantimonas coralicida]